MKIMSNEFKDWLEDKIYEIVLESGIMDKIEKISRISLTKADVYGWKNGQKISIEVWLDDDVGEWEMEHRETDK